jgi:hypothetical protein
MAVTTTTNPTKTYRREPLWTVRIVVILAFVLQLALPDRFVAGPKYLLPILELLLLCALFFTTPRQPIFRSILRRVNAVTLVALISIVNIYSVQQLVHDLLAGGTIVDGQQLILTAINVYVTNIIIFGLWFWELDGGGHGSRQTKSAHERDFLFPQMSTPSLEPHNWHPTFLDYLYISVTNATAFSPTDAMPLTHRAKTLMAIQAFVSLITIALVAARAVNILR